MVKRISGEEGRLYHVSQMPFSAENSIFKKWMKTFDKQPLFLIFELEMDFKIKIKCAVAATCDQQ